MIEDIVSPFLRDTNNSFLYYLSATREIVNGLKYVIVFAMKNETDDEVVCEMNVIEKPWLVHNHKKYRKMIYNNCSLTIEDDEDDKMRFQYDVNPSFINQREDMSQDDMNDLEEQIVALTHKPLRPKTSTTTTTMATIDDLTESLTDTSAEESQTPDSLPPPMETTTPSSGLSSPLSNMNMDALDEIFGIRKTAGNTHALPPSSTSIDNRSNNNEASEHSILSADKVKLEIEIKKVFSELFQNDPEFQKNIIALTQRNDDIEAQQNVISILANKLKEKFENLSDQQTAADSQNSESDIRLKRSLDLNPMFANEAVDSFLQKVKSLVL